MHADMFFAPILIAIHLWVMPGAPAWLDFSIAGYSLAYDKSHSQALIHDRKSGFYLKREIDCDGALITLELTRDRHEISGELSDATTPEIRGAQEKPLRNLKTGKGVKIGDGPDKLTERLGKPSKTERSGSRRQFLDHVYIWKSKPNGGAPVTYTETYTFKNGALIQVVFFRDATADQ